MYNNLFRVAPDSEKHSLVLKISEINMFSTLKKHFTKNKVSFAANKHMRIEIV